MWVKKHADFLLLLTFELDKEEVISISYDWKMKVGMCFVSNVTDPIDKTLHILTESELDVLKFKSILLAIQLGWKIDRKYLLNLS